MEFWIFSGLIVVLVIIAFFVWVFKSASADDDWHRRFEENLQNKFGSVDLGEIHERELQPAVVALQAGDYFAVTTHFTKLADELSSIALQSAISDFDIRYSKQLFDQSREVFLKKHKLFEPSGQIGSFTGPTPQTQFGAIYVPAKTLRYGTDWISLGSEIFPLVAVTDVEVYADGKKIVNYTSRASLGSGLLGTVLPGSALLWAMARPKVTRHEEDDRQACILVSGENFELELEIDPDEKKDARYFAKQLQKQVVIAKGGRDESGEASAIRTSGTETSAVETTKVSLEKLAQMYAQGLITDDEFSILKKNL